MTIKRPMSSTWDTFPELLLSSEHHLRDGGGEACATISSRQSVERGACGFQVLSTNVKSAGDTGPDLAIKVQVCHRHSLLVDIGAIADGQPVRASLSGHMVFSWKPSKRADGGLTFPGKWRLVPSDNYVGRTQGSRVTCTYNVLETPSDPCPTCSQPTASVPTPRLESKRAHKLFRAACWELLVGPAGPVPEVMTAQYLRALVNRARKHELAKLDREFDQAKLVRYQQGRATNVIHLGRTERIDSIKAEVTQ